ncbi:MAG: arylesterase [Balneolaceae bacterium]
MKYLLILFSFLAALTAEAQQTKTILFFGDSITAGLGVDSEQAFPALIQNKIDSLGLDYQVVNAGLSGETSAGGVRRINWVLQRKIDIMILELGGNDGLRGIPVPSTKENLQEIINKALANNPEMEIIIAGMQVPPNLGSDYAEEFRSIYPKLAEENGLTLIPFILEGVGGEEDLNQPDGIHPTEEGHKLIAEVVWNILAGVLVGV